MNRFSPVVAHIINGVGALICLAVLCAAYTVAGRF